MMNNQFFFCATAFILFFCIRVSEPKTKQVSMQSVLAFNKNTKARTLATSIHIQHRLRNLGVKFDPFFFSGSLNEILRVNKALNFIINYRYHTF